MKKLSMNTCIGMKSIICMNMAAPKTLMPIHIAITPSFTLMPMFQNFTIGILIEWYARVGCPT